MNTGDKNRYGKAKGRIEETANGRMGDLARSRVLPCANDPLLWMIDHAHELAQDVFVRVIDCLEFGVTDVAVTKCELDVHLRFGSLAFAIAQLGNESRGVAPLAPRLRVTHSLLITP